VNGYIGGERINKRLTYEQILAKSQESTRKPFEFKKKERVLPLDTCFKLEDQQLDQKHFDYAIKYLELRQQG